MLLKEVIMPRQPKGDISSINFKMGGHELISRKFVTKLGHEITVSFKWVDADTVDVMFSVDGLISDRKGVKDPELLPGVLWVLLKYVNENNINHFKFFAMTGEKDRKIKYNLPTDKIIKNIRVSADSLLKNIDTDDVYVHPTFLNMLKTLPTVDNNTTVNDLQTNLRIYRGYGSDIEDYPEHNELEKLLNNLVYAIRSHEPQGVAIERNRRKELYTAMVNRYFSKDWDISIDGLHFDLDRKVQQTTEASIVPDTKLKQLIAVGREQGFLTRRQLYTVLPADTTNEQRIDVLSMLGDMNIRVVN